jgi:hypothetical protein
MLLSLVLTLACTAPSDDTAAADTSPVDADGDGVLSDADCDDADADVLPGAQDPPGDAVDGDCDGSDGVAFAGCAPVVVPDVYPTIAEALAAGERDLCLGEGTFSLAPGADGPTALRGQGRARTRVTDPAAYGPIGVLSGLTATGTLSAGGSLSWTDVTVEDATLSALDSLMCERCAFVRTPIVLEVYERIAGIALTDTWLHGAETAIHVTTRGCTDASCSGWFVDVRMNNTTFTDNGSAIALDLEGDYDVYVVATNGLFLDNPVLLGVDATSDPRVYPSGSSNLSWGTDGDGFPDGASFRARDEDPLLDRAFSPPRPLEGSPAIDAAGDDATQTDFWGLPREAPDRGAVER